MEINSSRVKAWSIARSIHMANLITLQNGLEKERFLLEPFLVGDQKIGFGQKNPLVFDDLNIVKMVNMKFPFPEFGFIIKSPCDSVSKILRMIKISKILRQENQSKEHLELLLMVGLEATACYLNYSDKFNQSGECGCIQFLLGADEVEIAYIMRDAEGLWVAHLGKASKFPNAKLIFSNVSVGVKACMGVIDSKEAISQGDIIMKGRIPLLDFFGYASQITFLNVSLFR